MDSKYLKIILLAIASALFLSALIVPFLSSSGSIIDLDGTMGYIDHSDIWNTLDPFSAAIYTVGDFICHQQMSRTIILNGNEMPICVRDFGFLVGLVAGVLLMMVLKRYDKKKLVIISVAGLVLMFSDWIIQKVFSLNVPETRFITGIMAGIAATILFIMFMDGKISLDRR